MIDTTVGFKPSETPVGIEARYMEYRVFTYFLSERV